MRRLICTAAALLALAAPAWAQLGIRNISSVGVDADFDGTISLDINQVILFPVVRWMSGEVKLQRQDSPARSETTLSVAPIFLAGPYHYIIVRYGLGIGDAAVGEGDTGGGAGADQGADGGRAFSHSLTLDANRETESFYGNAAVRGAWYPAERYWFVLPTVGVRVPVGARGSVLGRYFVSYNSDGEISNALLAEMGWALSDRFTVKGGASGSVELGAPAGASGTAAAQGREPAWEVTGITGFSFRVTPGLALRYHLEYLGRIGGTDGVRNIVVLDAAF